MSSAENLLKLHKTITRKERNIKMATQSRPNVLWIFGDQHRAQALSCNGDKNARTPNLDHLASLGCNFNRAVSGTPLCSPFRAAIVSGLYPHKCIPGPADKEINNTLDPSLPTIASVLNENGYHTAYFGKWHCYGTDEARFNPAEAVVERSHRGHFRQWLGYENNNSQYNSWVHGHDGDGNEIEHYKLPGYETDALTDILISFIKTRAEEQTSGDGEPFFAALSVQPPHDPHVAPPEFVAHFNPESLELRENVPNVPRVLSQAKRELAGYYAQIENLDWNVGRIVAALRELGVYENTHIMYFSDHGDMHGSHGQFRKMNPYEEAIRIPFILSGTKANYHFGTPITDAPLNHVDIPATTLGLCGIDTPDWMDGYDYSGYKINSRKRDDEPDSAFIQGVHSLRHPNSIDKEWRGIVTRDGWKYVAFENLEWLLYNLNEDPYEQVNLAHNVTYVEKKEELNARLQKWIDDTGDVFELPKSFCQHPFKHLMPK